MPGIDYRTPEGRQLTMMRGVSSEGVYFAAKRRGDNVADAVVARGVANSVPYGYRRNAVNGVKSDPSKDAKALVPHSEHAAVVKKIFSMRLKGQRVAAIVRTLNDAGVPSPRGKRWTDATVETIVRNEVYTGVVKLGQRRNEGALKPLVSKSDWRKAQSTRAVTLWGTHKAGLAVPRRQRLPGRCGRASRPGCLRLNSSASVSRAASIASGGGLGRPVTSSAPAGACSGPPWPPPSARPASTTPKPGSACAGMCSTATGFRGSVRAAAA